MNAIERNWRDQIVTEYRAEYAPYDMRSEFDEGMEAFEQGIFACPYDGPGQPGYKAQAWERGLECSARLRFFFKWHRPLKVFGRWWS